MSDTRYMALALALAARGLGRTWPNPTVGCVLVREGRIVGRGWTQPGGRPHGERMALAQAGAAARGATAYVSLEPCAHHGLTPPCAEALIAAGVARVVTALTDPDTRVSGRGHALLRAAGIAVTEGVMQAEATRMNAGFLQRVLQGTPRVTLKLGLSLDGRITTDRGQSRWITGPAARRLVHAQRALHDAVMVGIGTALADDPDLTVRDLGVAHQPLRIVVDSRLRLPPTARMLARAAEVPVWICHAQGADPACADALTAAGARLIPCIAEAAGRVEILDMLRRLGSAGLTRIYCEGGGELAASLQGGGHLAEVIAFSAGRLFGSGGTPCLGPIGASLPSEAEYRLVECRAVGDDLLHRWERRRREA